MKGLRGMRHSDQFKRQNLVVFGSIVLVFVLLSLIGVQNQAYAGGKATATPTVPPTATPPPGPTPGPCTTCNGSLPKHVLTGYWQDFVNSALPLRLRDVPTSYGLVAVAFAGTGTTTGSITFSIDAKLSSALSGYSITDFANDVQLLHSQGRKVILSVGGAAGNVTIASASAASNF